MGLAIGSSRLLPALWAPATVVVVVEPLPRSAARGIVTVLSFVTGMVRDRIEAAGAAGAATTQPARPSAPNPAGPRGG